MNTDTGLRTHTGLGILPQSQLITHTLTFNLLLVLSLTDISYWGLTPSQQARLSQDDHWQKDKDINIFPQGYHLLNPAPPPPPSLSACSPHPSQSFFLSACSPSPHPSQFLSFLSACPPPPPHTAHSTRAESQNQLHQNNPSFFSADVCSSVWRSKLCPSTLEQNCVLADPNHYNIVYMSLNSNKRCSLRVSKLQQTM